MTESHFAEKQKNSPGISFSDPVPVVGRKILRFHLNKMKSNEIGTRLGEDINAFHDMRVAIRRMRGAISIFENYFDPVTIKKIRIGLRKSGKSLGRVRDDDVLIERLDYDLSSASPEEKKFSNW